MTSAHTHGSKTRRFVVFAALLLLVALIFAVRTNETKAPETANNQYSDRPYTAFNISLLPDPDKSLTTEAVLSMLDQFVNVETRSINLGFGRPAEWFFVTDLLPTKTYTGQETDDGPLSSFYLEIAYPLLDLIDLVLLRRVVRSGAEFETVNHFATGDRHPFAKRPIPHPNFVFPLNMLPNYEYAALIRVETDSTLQLPMRLWTQHAFTGENFDHALFFGGLIGIIFIVGVSNLFLFISVGDRAYLYFALGMMNYSLVIACVTGLAYQYLWPESIYLQQRSLLVVAALGLSMLLLFAREFLDLKTAAPRLSILVAIVAVATLALAALMLILPYTLAAELLTLNIVVTPLLTYGIAFWLLSRGSFPAGFYVFAVSVLVGAVCVFALSKFGFIESSFGTEYAIHFGAVISVSLFSFALADRIRLERKLKKEAQDAAIRHLDSYRSIYENSLEGLFQLDRWGRLLVCNTAFLNLLGARSKQELIAQAPTFKGLLPASLEDFRRLFAEMQETGRLIGQEVRCLDLSGTPFWGMLTLRSVSMSDLTQLYEGSLMDVSERRSQQEQLQYLVGHDPLTGLMNRLEFEKRVKGCIDSAVDGQREHAMLFMDLDQFKIVNDTGGHSAGDELLRQLAEEFRSILKGDDTVARIGGDEFAILLNDCDLDEAKKVGERVREAVTDFRFAWEDKTFPIGVSIGIVAIDADITTLENLFSLADNACYAAKDAGRNRVVVHSKATETVRILQGEMLLVGELRNAINSDMLRIYTQPIKPLQRPQDGEAYELLVRFETEGRILLPGAFLPAAERFNVVNLIDRWVIERYFSYLYRNPQALSGLTQANINLSAQTIGAEDFPEFLTRMFTDYQIPCNRICFEITESAAVASLTDTRHFLNSMRKSGLRFALDDFGSGFSSYSYLKSLPVDYLKIDGMFIRGVFDDPVDLAMVKSITEIAHLTNMAVCAEYVESEPILQLMQHLGVDYAQGFYIGEPELLVLDSSPS